MVKRLIAYQRLLLSSTPSIEIRFKNPLKRLLSVYTVAAVLFINMYIFMGHVIFTNSSLAILLALFSIWKINRILNGSERLFETVPISRKYTLFNIYLLSIVIILVGYIIFWVGFAALIWLLLVILYIVKPENITSNPETAAVQIINTTKGNILMLCIFAIILFVGIAIAFVKRKKLRVSCFTGITVFGYGLLFLLRYFMPVSPNTGSIEFAESFSIMPQANTILICTAIATVIICIISALIAYNLYVNKLKDKGLSQNTMSYK